MLVPESVPSSEHVPLPVQHERDVASQYEDRKVQRARRRKLRDVRGLAAGLFVLSAFGVLRTVLPMWDAPKSVAAPTQLSLANAPKCDVVVVGATPAGVAAAISAARRGMNVVLLEERNQVGGDIVYAMLNMFDLPVTPKSEQSPVAHGIFGEFYDKLGVAFDVNEARDLFAEQLKKDRVTVHLNTRIARLFMNGSRLSGLSYKTGNGPLQRLACSAMVDATNDATVAARAGAGYYIGRESANPDKRMQSAGLLFSVKDVKWSQLYDYVHTRKEVPLSELLAIKRGVHQAIDVHLVKEADGEQPMEAIIRLGGGSGKYLWERGDIVKPYVPRMPDIQMLSINFGRQDSGSVVLNTMNIIGVNGLDETSKKQGRAEAMEELPHFLFYLKKHLPGFEDAKLDQVAPELYIRETRHIHGYYTLKVADIKAETRFPDRIALCSYPLDLHPYMKGDINPFGPKRYFYTLPLRCLVPRRVDGIFVASRSLSASYSAAGSARVIPVTMAAGEAAGAAAWVCAREGITPHELISHPEWINVVQDTLRASGANVGDTFPSTHLAPGLAQPRLTER
jgi:hypothetical protein